MKNKQVIKINESQLRQIVTEAVKMVLKEGIYYKGKTPTYKYEGTKEDKYMWWMKKDAEKKNMTRGDGWPSCEYIDKWWDKATKEVDSDLSGTVPTNDDYSIEDLWELVDSYLYLRNLKKFDVLGRPNQSFLDY